MPELKEEVKNFRIKFQRRIILERKKKRFDKFSNKNANLN